jgi:hypothetical protein
MISICFAVDLRDREQLGPVPQRDEGPWLRTARTLPSLLRRSDRLTKCFKSILLNWFTDRLTKSFTSILLNWFTDRLTKSFTSILLNWFTDRLTKSFTSILLNWFTDRLTKKFYINFVEWVYRLANVVTSAFLFEIFL